MKNNKLKTHRFIFAVSAAIMLSASLATAQSPYVTDVNTVALYHFNETTGTTATDNSGNNYNATYRSAATIGLPSAPGLGNSFKSSSSLNGRVSWEDTNDILENVFQGDFTIEAWIKFDDLTFTNGNRYLFALQPGTTNTSRDLSLSILHTGGAISPENHLALALGDSSNDIKTHSGGVSWELGGWYHIAVTVTHLENSQSEVRFYINQAGDSTTPEPFATKTISDLVFHDTENNRGMNIGNYYGNSGTQFFPGQIDEVRISNIARTEFTTIIPEPSSVMWFGALGLGIIVAIVRRKKRVL